MTLKPIYPKCSYHERHPVVCIPCFATNCHHCLSWRGIGWALSLPTHRVLSQWVILASPCIGMLLLLCVVCVSSTNVNMHSNSSTMASSWCLPSLDLNLGLILQRASCATYRRGPHTLHHERLSTDKARSRTMQRHWDDLTRIAQQELTLSIFHTIRSLIMLVFITSHLVYYSTMTSLDL